MDTDEEETAVAKAVPEAAADEAGSDVVEFCGLRIAFDGRVLTPRAWTELQSRWAAELLAAADPGPVLELCSGAGHLGLATAALSGRSLVCVDVNPAAAELTRRNADANGLGELVEVREARLQEAVEEDEVFAMVVADPPWVPTDGVTQFPEDPVLAIDGGDDGLDLARACLGAATGHLPSGGALLLQLGGTEQADALDTWASRSGWTRGGLRLGERGVVVLLLHP